MLSFLLHFLLELVLPRSLAHLLNLLVDFVAINLSHPRLFSHELIDKLVGHLRINYNGYEPND